MKFKARKGQRRTQTTPEKIASEIVLSLLEFKSCISVSMCECLQQVPRQRVRSTTEGEVLLTKLLGGEGSALGEMVRFVSLENSFSF